MRMPPVCTLLWAVMVLTQAAEAGTGNNPTAISRLVKRSRCCPRGWTKIGQRCFLFVPRPMSWARAEKNCLSMRANLASVRNINEYHKIQRMIVKATHAFKETWLGGTDAQENNVWFWSDGRPLHYSNWCHGEPNNKHQRCLQMNYGDSNCWDNVQCNVHRPSVCTRKMR